MSLISNNISLYSRWINMKHRCYNPKFPNYRHYGGRGITICNEWLESFESFLSWALANNYRQELDLDRADNNGNYEPNNCRFVTKKENTRNRRIATTMTVDGVTKTVSEWAEITGMPYDTMFRRVKLGWEPKDVFRIHKGLRSFADKKVQTSFIKMPDQKTA
jgi:hypothetical protein